jgi:hypothetical protein
MAALPLGGEELLFVLPIPVLVHVHSGQFAQALRQTTWTHAEIKKKL